MSAPRFLLFFIATLSFLAAATFGQQSRFRVLAFYSETTEPDHVQFAKDAVRFLTQRAQSEHFTFDVTSNWKDLNDEHLKGYQLVVWLNESPSSTEARNAFERYIEHGGSWLGFHAAAYNDQDTNWPWFVDFLGGAVFSMNSWPPLPARIDVDDRAHDVMLGVPHEFESPSNEWYIWKPNPRVNPNVRILATLDPSNYPLGFKDVLTGGDLPVVWTNTKYKMLYINMGHGDKIFASPTQNKLIDNAVAWLATGAERGTLKEGNGIRVNAHGIVVNQQTGKFYAVNTQHDSVAVLDSNGHFLSHTLVGKGPVSIGVNSDSNRIYVANSGSGDVSVIDGATDKVVATVPVGDLPYTIAVNRSTDKVFVSRTFSDVTVIIDGKTNKPTTVKAGVGDAVAAESLRSGTYMTSFESIRMAVFDGKDDLTSKIDTPNHMWAMAANEVNNKIYAASVGNSNVTVVDGKSHSAKVLSLGEIPCALAVDDSSGKVYVANFGSNNISVIDGDTDAVIKTLSVEKNPQAIAVDSGNHRVYVASMHESVATVVDGTNDAVLGNVKLQMSPFALAVNNRSHVAVALSLNGDLTLIDGATMATSSPVIPESKR